MPDTQLEFKDLQTTADYQLMIDEVQSLMYADADPDEPTLDRVQRNYAEAVKQVNRRLDECEELLRKGYRNECLQACEREPKLLDVAMLLDFPESSQWPVYLKQFGRPAPPEPKTDIAAELNEAYALAESLADLMYKHRVHALAHSSLRVRIDLMRKIARQDANNPIWEEDLKTFEKARQHHAQSEFKDAASRGDFETLSQLDKELNSDAWLLPPPAELVKRVADACSRLRVIEARTDLQRIGAELGVAYAENDLARARTARTAWNDRSSVARMAADDPLATAAQVPLEWLRKQDLIEQEQRAYDAAIAELEQALDKGAGRLVLDRKAHAVARFDRGMPEQLERRLATRSQQLQEALRGRRRFKLVATVVALLGACCLAGYLIFLTVRGSEVRSHMDSLQKLLDAKDYDKLGQRFSDIERDNAVVFKSPEVQHVRDKWQNAVKNQDEHQASFQERLKEVRSRGLEKPDFDGIAAARTQAEALWDDRADEREENQVTKLREELDQAERDLQRSVDTAFRNDFDGLRKLPADNLKGLQELRELGQRLLGRPHVSAAEQGELKKWLTSDVNPRIEKLNLGTEEAALLQRITEAVGNPTEFRKQLDAYSGNPKFDQSRAGDFKKLLQQETSLWEGIKAWNGFIAEWSGRNLVDLPDADQKKLTTEAKKLLEGHGNLPPAEPARQAVSLLAKVAQRPAMVQKITGSIKNDLITKPLVLSFKDEGVVKNYYTIEEPKKTAIKNQWNIFKVLNSRLEVSKKSTPVSGTLENGRANGKTDWQAPQSRFSDSAQKLLGRINSVNWDETMLDVILLLQNDTKIDSILKAILLETILQDACKGSLVLEKVLTSQQRNILPLKFDKNANWIDPDDKNANALRIEAAKALEKKELRIPPSAKVDAAQRLKDLRMFNFGEQYNWLGWLRKDLDGKWMCSLKLPADSGPVADVFVFVLSGATQPVRPAKVGNLAGGKVQLDAAQTTLFLEGRAVFVVRRK